MSVQQPSRAVRIGYVLTTLLLVASVAFAAFLLVDGAVGVARGGERLVSGRSLDVHVQVPPERVRLPDGLRHDGWLPAVARIQHPSSWEIALSTALDLTQAALFIAVLWLLRGLARSVREGDPFDAANVQRLRGIGSLLAFGGLLVEIVDSSIRAQLWQALPRGASGISGRRGSACRATCCSPGWGRSSWRRSSRRACACARISRERSEVSPADADHRISVHLDRLLERRGMTLTELAELVDLTSSTSRC